MIEKFYRADVLVEIGDVAIRFELAETGRYGLFGFRVERHAQIVITQRESPVSLTVRNRAAELEISQPESSHAEPSPAVAEAIDRLPEPLRNALLRLQKVRIVEE